ncbi:alpha/beta fold hydrolase [Actinoplanes sp. NPDC049265]|uniref:alpha/beta fold hydrolase n=1 Tax=Actinoplanes sp. NPDC049265 TaxID=3363902 RepID=UPI003716782F
MVLHYRSEGIEGPPILLVHGFPETSLAFRRLMPLLARNHRVFAADLRGFGDSEIAPDDFDSAAAAADLHELIEHLGVGPVHLTGQDISGAAVVRLAAAHPDDLLSLTAIEMGLAGFGLEALADVTHGGTWHIGVMAAPGVPELMLAGKEREFLTMILGTEPAEEVVRAYARPGGWRGAAGLYRSMLREGDELKGLRLTVPVLAVGAGTGDFTSGTMARVAAGEFRSARIGGGHYAATDAPGELAEVLLDFYARNRFEVTRSGPS